MARYAAGSKDCLEPFISIIDTAESFNDWSLLIGYAFVPDGKQIAPNYFPQFRYAVLHLRHRAFLSLFQKENPTIVDREIGS